MSSIEIPLTLGKYAIIDKEDLEFVMRHKWRAGGNPSRNQFYASTGRGGDSDHLIKMHSYIMDCPEGLVVDHINGDSLDNRKSNLRICTKAENGRNLRKSSYGKNIFKGVTKRIQKNGNIIWYAHITSDRKRYHIGCFSTEVEAARAYNDKALELHGEFARLNRGILPSHFKLVFTWKTQEAPISGS